MTIKQVACTPIVVLLLMACDRSPTEPDSKVETVREITRDSTLVSALARVRPLQDPLKAELKRGRFNAVLRECEAFERLSDGSVRIGRFALKSRAPFSNAIRSLRIVAAILTKPGKAPIGIQCGVDLAIDAKEALRSAKYEQARAALDDSGKARVYGEAQLLELRNQLSDQARAEGRANLYASQRRLNAQMSLFPTVQFSVCPLNNPPTQGCTSLGGVQIVADVLPPHSGAGGFDTYGLGDGWEGFYSRADEILLEADQPGCENISCAGTGSTPPESVYGMCPTDENVDAPPPFDNSDDSATQVCEGSNARSCMASNPGVWVGSWAIPNLSFVGARHSAVVTQDDYGLRITELFNSDYLASQPPAPQQHIHYMASETHYGSVETYKWVRVAGPYYIPLAQDAGLRATWEYGNRPYTLSSNRFVSALLKTANITLTPTQRSYLGSTPGICWCGSCS